MYGIKSKYINEESIKLKIKSDNILKSLNKYKIENELYKKQISNLELKIIQLKNNENELLNKNNLLKKEVKIYKKKNKILNNKKVELELKLINQSSLKAYFKTK